MGVSFSSILIHALCALAPLAGPPAHASDLFEEAVDTDRNGRPDLWRSRDAAGNLSEVRRDRNGDRKPDYWIRYLDDRTSIEGDENFDGTPDRRHTELLDAEGNMTERRTDVLESGEWRLAERWTLAGPEMFQVSRWKPGGAEEIRYESAVVKLTDEQHTRVRQFCASRAGRNQYHCRYRACFLNRNSVGSDCELQVNDIVAMFYNETRRLELTSLGAPGCDDGAGSYYTGQGYIIDTRSCGPRAACPGVAPNACSPADPPFWNDEAANAPLGVWCSDCEGGPCMSCRSRESRVEDIDRMSRRGVGRLMQCFSPTDPSSPETRLPNEFTHPALNSLFLDTFDYVGRRGAPISCPSSTQANAETLGDANSGSRRIRLYPGHLESDEIGAQHGAAATFGHEFMHLTAVMGDRKLDNHVTETHNHPGEHHHYESVRRGEAWDEVTTGDPRTLVNREYDRVYQCEALCYAKSFVSRESCNLCLSYPTAVPDAAVENASGVTVAAGCEGFTSRAALDGATTQLVAAAGTLNGSTGPCTASLDASILSLTDEPGAEADVAGIMIDGRGIYEVRRQLECLEYAANSFNTSFRAIETGTALDPFNRMVFRKATRRILANKIVDRVTRACELIAALRRGADRTPSNRSTLRTFADVLTRGLSDVRAKWNTIAADGPFPDGQGGSMAPQPVASEDPAALCTAAGRPTILTMSPVSISI